MTWKTWSFNFTKVSRVQECSVCGTGRKQEKPKEELILEELCGRNKGKRTFSITPTYSVTLNVDDVTSIAREKGFVVENLGDLGLSMRTNDLSVKFHETWFCRSSWSKGREGGNFTL